MLPVLYWPYDEISLRLNDEGTFATVGSPWLEATVGVTSQNLAKIEELSRKFGDHSLAPADLPLINWFFSEFSHLPFCYVLPSPLAQGGLDVPSIDDGSLHSVSLDSFFSLTCPMLSESETSPSHALKLARNEWDWDAQAALTFATAGGAIHPQSLLSVARRYHLLDVVEGNAGRAIFAEISRLPASDFAQAVGLMVRQNHYVTAQCQNALRPALDKAGRARPAVEHFMKEENGHDRILGVALQAVDASALSLPVSKHTQVLMHLLEFAARRNFLAFAMAVDFFERSTYEKIDPLSQLLASGGLSKAATYVNRHKEINDAGEHENVSSSFLDFLAPCDPLYALEALRIAEAINLLMNSIPASAFELYKARSA